MKQSQINENEILNSLLNQIVLLTQHDTDFNVKIVLPAYCKRRDLERDYDGLFWGNEGATWKYKNNLDIVKLVDLYFVTYRKINYPELPHKNMIEYLGDDEWGRSEFPTRYDCLKNQNELF